MAELSLNNSNNEISMAENADYSDTFLKRMEVVWKQFKKNKLAVIGLITLVILYLSAIFAPLLSPYSPEGTSEDLYMAYKAPTFTSYQVKNSQGQLVTYKPNYFGRDEFGRDVFTRCLHAGRISLSVGFVSVGISMIIGIVWGCIAGYYGGWIDNIMMRVVDAINCIPVLMLLIVVMAIFPPSIFNIMFVIGITGWTGIARYVRAEFLSLMKRDYAEAAKNVGAKDRRIIFKHILPNAMNPIIVNAVFGISGAILAESALSFLGLGVQPPIASWGNMLSKAQNLNTMISAPWNAIYPGLLIFITILAFNFFGDGLRDALDPRLKQ